MTTELQPTAEAGARLPSEHLDTPAAMTEAKVAQTSATEAPAVDAPAADAPAESDSQTIPALSPQQRQALVEQALSQARLPRGLRERLQATLSSADHLAVDPSSGEPLMRVSELVALVEKSLPHPWQLDRQSLARPDHPAGEAFFTGDDSDVSDAQAEQVARAQLARSGYLKSGQ